MPRRQLSVAFALAAVTTAVALTYSRSAHAQGQLSDCDPLDPTICALPFPNNFWLRPNADGDLRVAFGAKTFPADCTCAQRLLSALLR